MEYGITTFDARLEELKEAREFWQTQGFNATNSRIGVYERELQALVTMGPEGRDNLTQEEAGRVYLTLPEIGDFLFVSKVAMHCPRLASTPRINNIFSGPELAKDEETSTHANPRNTLFELAIAAAAERAELNVDLSGVTDVKTIFDGVPIRLECKRPQNMKKAETAIRRAVRQLEDSNTPDSLGIIVVCVGKLMTNGQRILVAKNRAAMEARIYHETENFLNAVARFWHNKANVAGIIVRVNVPGIVEEQNRPYHASMFTATNRPDLPIEQRRVLSGFLRRLQAGIAAEGPPSAQ